MRVRYLSSIILLADTEWSRLRQCLVALQGTLRNQPCEILVFEQDGAVSRASSSSRPHEDTTTLAATGKALFGDAFRHECFEGKVPRGALLNRGADLARGEFLVFMDGSAIALDDWHEQLLHDFTKYPTIAATAPLLVNPAPVVDWQVRHMGTFITPFPTFGSLYGGIPATAPLVRERRFFQTLDPACVMLRRTLLHSVGKFDERLSDGIETTELCSRLSRAGHTMTVNPATIVQLPVPAPQIPDSTKDTLLKLWQGNQLQLRPDWHSHMHRDRLFPKMDTWGMLYAEPAHHMKTLPPILSSGNAEAMGALKEMLEKFPLDARLYIALARALENEGQFAQALWALEASTRMHLEPEAALALKRIALRDATLEQRAGHLLTMFTRPFPAYVNMVEKLRVSCLHLGLEDLAGLATEWLAGKETIFTNQYRPLMAQLREMDKPCGSTCTTSCPENAQGALPAQPVVSVIIPAYNYAAFLPYTLENVLAEKGVTLDVVVVDDGSADNTREVVQSFGAAVRYIHQENQGLPAARNTGIAAATGKYMVFLDADDLFYPGTLLSQCTLLENTPKANMSICQNLLFEGPEPAGPFTLRYSLPLPKDGLPVFFCCRNVAPVHAFMIRRPPAEATLFFDTSMRAVEDYDYWLRCLSGGEIPVINRRGLVYYRQHDTSMSKNSKQQIAHEIIIRGRVEKILSENPLFASGMKAQAWVAHAARCINLAGDSANYALDSTPEMMRAGVYALQRATTAYAEEENGNSAYADTVARYLALRAKGFLDGMSAAGLGYFPEARQILKTLFPDTGLGKRVREDLLDELASQLYEHELPLSNLTHWQMEHPWQG